MCDRVREHLFAIMLAHALSSARRPSRALTIPVSGTVVCVQPLFMVARKGEGVVVLRGKALLTAWIVIATTGFN